MINKETPRSTQFTPKGRLRVVKGSILMPECAGLRLILSPCSIGLKSEGSSYKPTEKLYTVLDKKWKKAKEELRGWHATRQGFELGAIMTTAVQSDTWLVSMLVKDAVGQADMKGLTAALKKIVALAKEEKASVHVSNLTIEEMPELSDLLVKSFVDNGVNLYLYEEMV